MPTGYSGKPLFEKLGIKPGQRVCVINPPDDYEKLMEGRVPGMTVTGTTRGKADMAHIFATESAQLAARLPTLMRMIAPDGAVWVSWPKKAAKMKTNLTEDVIRDVALPMGLVDVKVCAVNDVWSGLKLVIRKERR